MLTISPLAGSSTSSIFLKKLIFVYGVSIDQDIYFSQTDVQVFQHHFLCKDYSLSNELIL